VLKLIDSFVFDVASYRGLTDADILRQPGSWLLSQYEHVMRGRWNDMMSHAVAVELGVSRGVSVALSSKKVNLPPLPSFEDTFKLRSSHPAARPAWVDKFERVNRVGRYATKNAENIEDTEPEL